MSGGVENDKAHAIIQLEYLIQHTSDFIRFVKFSRVLHFKNSFITKYCKNICKTLKNVVICF